MNPEDGIVRLSERADFLGFIGFSYLGCRSMYRGYFSVQCVQLLLYPLSQGFKGNPRLVSACMSKFASRECRCCTKSPETLKPYIIPTWTTLVSRADNMVLWDLLQRLQGYSYTY